MALLLRLDFLWQQFIAALLSRRRYRRGVGVCFPRLSVWRVGEQGVRERHQEGFDGVEFGRGDGAVMREIVDDAP